MTHQIQRVEPVNADSVAIGYSIVPRPNADVLADKLQQLAAFRYAKETGGITLGGASIATDRASQFALTSAYISLKDGLLASVDWKANGSWVQVTLPQIQPIAQAVAVHVQACFTREKQLYDVLVALQADPAAVAGYDITVGWPV